MKTIYMIYAILFKGASVLRVNEHLDSKNVEWCAHDQPQDGYGGHSGNWVSAKNPQDAVWKLYHT